MSLEDWIELAEAAARLQRHPTQVRALVRAGGLEAQRIGPDGRGGRWLVSAAGVEALAAAWEANPPRRGRPASDTPSPAAAAQRRSRRRRAQETEVSS